MDARNALIARLLEGPAHASQSQRRAAFDNARSEEPLRTLIHKVAIRANEITDEDLSAVRAAGLNEDQILELIVCGAVGQAMRQHDDALAALKIAAEKA